MLNTRKEKNHEYYIRHKEEILTQQKNYKKEIHNKLPTAKEYMRKYYFVNKERLLAEHKIYYIEHKEKISAQQRIWRARKNEKKF